MTSQKDHIDDLFKNRVQSFANRLEPWEVSDIIRLYEGQQIVSELNQKHLLKKLGEQITLNAETKSIVEEVVKDLRSEKQYKHSDKLRKAILKESK